jgi:DNA-binding CsgD family transcriptional regulator
MMTGNLLKKHVNHSIVHLHSSRSYVRSQVTVKTLYENTIKRLTSKHKILKLIARGFFT